MKMSAKVLLSCMIVAFSQLGFALDQPEPTVNGTYQIEANWSELTRGWNVLQLTITDSQQHPVLGSGLEITYDMVGMPMGPPNNPVVEIGNGQYEKKIFLGMSGKWQFDMKMSNNGSEDSFSKVQNTNH